MESDCLEEQKLTAEDFAFLQDDEKAASAFFGIKYLFPWQRIVISNILDSAGFTESAVAAAQENATTHDNAAASVLSEDDAVFKGKQIVLLPTGAGKSLCFLIPAVLLKGPTLVLYPLLALMSDQKRRMDEGGIKSVVFRGGMTPEEKEENFRLIKEGAKIILANPEVLQNQSLVAKLKMCGISHIAIDEAHCVSEWGDSFRPAYLTLGKIIENLGVKTVTAFTATASPQVLERVCEVLFKGEAHIVRSDSDRPNIHYKVINAWAKKREAFRLAFTCEKPLIIFCGTRKKSEDMARELSVLMGSSKVRFYHAGLKKEEKDAVEKWFYPQTDAVLCCTCAFGMGVDKKNIRTVIHLEPSPTAESYIQEAGRGGRDGSVAEGILLWSKSDSLKAAKFPDGSREKVMKKFAESSTCRRQVLLDALGGEQAACSGCDVCERGGKSPFAEDAAFVYSFVKKYGKLYSREGLTTVLVDEFNRRDRKLFGVNVWDAGDVEEILSQLEASLMIHECSFPWSGKVSAGAKGALQTKISVIENRYFPRLRLLRLQRVRPAFLLSLVRRRLFSGKQA